MPAAGSTFRWTEDCSVQIALLDQQHQTLFDTINELDHALRLGAGNASVDAVLQKLVQYTASHFTAEEALMAQHSFPGLSTHQAEHDRFRGKIAQFLEEHRAGKAGVPVSLLFFMQSWLKRHVLKTDKQYSSFLTARGVR